MSYRQFMWGLSNGVLVLTLAGGFWIGIVGSIVHRPEILGPLGLGVTAVLIWGFVWLRKKAAGFSLSEIKKGTPEQRESLQRIRRGLRWATIMETLLCAAAVGAVNVFHRVDLMFPAIGLAVSLHFLPLGALFHVRRYYFTGVVGAMICVVGMIALRAPSNALFAASGMCLNMWGTAIWLVAGSEQIAAKALSETAAATTA